MEILKALDEYIPVATSTESVVKMQLERPDGDSIEIINARFLHGAMGLCTEVGELEEALDAGRQSGVWDMVNIVEECGDVIWYLAITVDSLGLKFSDLKYDDEAWIGFNLDRAISKMVQSSDQILDKAKRTIFYGKDLEMDKITTQLKHLIHALSYACEIEVAIDKVTRKLTGKDGRYEKGFSQDEAYDRDLGKERGILEK